MNIGTQILKIRNEKGLTQEEFGKIFHVTRQTVSNWENEKSYPDLQIHRIMSDALSGHMDQRRQEHYEDCLPAVCVQCSNKERQADDAEREVVGGRDMRHIRPG